MSTAAPFLARLTAALDAAGIEHMVAGSFASTFHGVPRTTQDIDIVIKPTLKGLKVFLRGLSEDEYYWSEPAAIEALRTRGQFNVIDLETGWKVDLLILKAREFSRVEFDRRQPAEVLGVPVMVATAEDTVIAKLEWSKGSGSERQLRDVAGVLEVAVGGLDFDYIEAWVSTLNLVDEWERVRNSGLAGGTQ